MDIKLDYKQIFEVVNGWIEKRFRVMKQEEGKHDLIFGPGILLSNALSFKYSFGIKDKVISNL